MPTSPSRRSRRTAGCSLALLLAPAALVLPSTTARAATPTEQAFGPTGDAQVFVVPSGVTTLQVTAVGAAAVEDGGPSGAADSVEAYLPVGPDEQVHAGDRLVVRVGGLGRPDGRRAFNGGGAGGTGGGTGGGGATDLRSPAGGLADRLVVAGGAGGAGGGGWAGGGNAGGPGWSEEDGLYGGQGATTAAGGPGAYDGPDASGRSGQGGDGRADGGDDRFGGGGGGGGYFGGGGGSLGPSHHFEFYGAGGGGGGSSWTSPHAVVGGQDLAGLPASLTLRWWPDGPRLAGHGRVTVAAQGPQTPVRYEAPTATDHSGRAVPVTCVPASGGGFGVGTTHVGCLSRDADGAVGAGGFDVVVRDWTAPVLGAPPVVVAAATGRRTAVTFPVPSAVDAVEGPRRVGCAPGPGSSFPVGVTAVRCTGSDRAGNVGVVTGSVTVRDQTPPRLAPSSDVHVTTSGTAARVVYPLPHATDAVDGRSRARCRPAPSTSFPVGTTTVTCTARDHAGNSSARTFAVVVTIEPAPR